MSEIKLLEHTRFSGIRTFMRAPMHNKSQHADVSIIGIPFDSGASFRTGARFGPSALREASLNILKPYCSVLDVHMTDYITYADYGDIATIPGYTEDSLDIIENEMSSYYSTETVPVVLGGDHTISLPELRALSKIKGPVALLHFDAHSDTIPEYFGKPYNHGSPFYHALNENLIVPEHSIQIGIRGPFFAKSIFDYPKQRGLRIVMGEELHMRGCDAIIQEAIQRIGDMPTFLSFDIDFLDAAYAPGTGTPEVEGFTSHQALYMVREICKKINVVGMDLVEVLPDKDPTGITALAGATIVHAFMGSLAYRKMHS